MDEYQAQLNPNMGMNGILTILTYRIKKKKLQQ